jgi:hypothetical protein
MSSLQEVLTSSGRMQTCFLGNVQWGTDVKMPSIMSFTKTKIYSYCTNELSNNPYLNSFRSKIKVVCINHECPIFTTRVKRENDDKSSFKIILQ